MTTKPSRTLLLGLAMGALLGLGPVTAQAHDYDGYYERPHYQHYYGGYRNYWQPPPPAYVIGPPAFVPPPVYLQPPSITIGIPPFGAGFGYFPPPPHWHGGHHGWHH